jgi:hypothetical protein
MRGFLGGVLLCLVAGVASADEYPVIVGDPQGCHLEIDYEAREDMLRLRPRSPSNGRCEVPLSAIKEGLGEALKLKPDIDLIFLGRLTAYAGMSRTLMHRANKDPRWDSVAGESRDGHVNNLVAALLADPKKTDDALMFVREALAAKNFKITRVSVEKVLVLCVFDSKTVPSGCHPSDALVHLRIAKVP